MKVHSSVHWSSQEPSGKDEVEISQLLLPYQTLQLTPTSALEADFGILNVQGCLPRAGYAERKTPENASLPKLTIWEWEKEAQTSQ